MSAGLIEALESFGMIVDREPILDGTVHRYRIAGRKGRPGFVLGNVVNGKHYATFGTWGDRTLDQKWPVSGKGNVIDSEHWQELIATANLIREHEQSKAASKAAWMWENSKECEKHPYLEIKQVQSHGCRVYKESLLIPVYDSQGDITTVQWIKPDGEKLFLKSGKKQGCCYPIQGNNDVVYIAEGFATGATINELTGDKVLVAFDAGNLKPVAENARRLYPDTRIIIAADNDHKTKGNPGVKHAEQAAEAIGADVVIPEGRGTDFNDMALEIGAKDTLARLKRELPAIRFKSIHEIMNTDYPPLKWAVKGIIPEGLTILAGRPKFGKSWLMLGLGYAIATGIPAWGFGETEQGSVYYLALEDSDRRIQDRVKSMEGYFDTYPKDFQVVFDFPRIGKGFLREVGKIIKNDPNIRCIIVDTLQKIRPKSNGGKRNLYQAEYEDYERVQRLAIEAGVPIICIHHTKKSVKGAKLDNPMDEMSGSTGIQGVADTLIVCVRDGNKGVMHVTGREVDEEDYPMEFVRFNMTWKLSAPGSNDIDVGPMVLTDWFKSNEEITTKQTAEVFGLNRRRAGEKLQGLVDEGKLYISRTGDRGARYYAPTEIFLQPINPAPEEENTCI